MLTCSCVAPGRAELQLLCFELITDDTALTDDDADAIDDAFELDDENSRLQCMISALLDAWFGGGGTELYSELELIVGVGDWRPPELDDGA